MVSTKNTHLQKILTSYRAVELWSSLGKRKHDLGIIELNNTNRKINHCLIVNFYIVACAIRYVSFYCIILSSALYFLYERTCAMTKISPTWEWAMCSFWSMEIPENDLLSLNNPWFRNFIHCIIPEELEIKDATGTVKSAS